MTVKIDGTNTVANPAFTGADTDTGLQCGTNEVKLVTGGTARATVDSSGRVGIGTPSPVRSLHVAVNGADPQLRLQDTSASESIYTAIEFNGDSSRQAFIGKAGSTDLLVINDNSSGALRLYTNSTERMRILPGGGLTFNGDTAQANALDDYEEGTWTPGIIGSNIVLSANDGRYVKVGKVVFIHCFVAYTSGTVSSTFSILTGSPFTSRKIGRASCRERV